MRIWPRTRRRRVILLAIVGLIALSSPRWYPAVEFGVNVVVPGPAVRAADGRTSDAATKVVDRRLPAPRSGPPTGPGIERLRVERVAALVSPIAVADPPGPGPVIVATQAGRLLDLDLTTGRTRDLADLSSRIVSGGEQGLLGVAVDPDGTRLFANFTDKRGDTRVVSWPFSGGAEPAIRLADEVEHLRVGQPFPNHNGGNLVFGPDGVLWIGLGDGGGAGDRNGNAQRTTTLLGKMLRVVPRPEGGIGIPTGNRLASNGRVQPDQGRPEIWAIGLRNPWRYSFDRATNRLWVADVGQNTIEEVSVIDPDAHGPNFGWNLLEGRNRYEGRAHRGLTAPVITYDHDDGCSVTGGYVYRGTAIPALFGWYVFSDYCSGWIRAVPSDDPTRRPQQLADDVGRVITFAELEDGELLLGTTTGLYRIMG